jgi:hypothetical protein
MICASALCPAPPLLIPSLTGAAQVAPELREACRAAVAELTASDPEVVAVVGAGEATAAWAADERFDPAAFAPWPGRPAGPGGLPASLGVGAWLLDHCGYAGERILQAVATDEPAECCARIGADLAASPERTALLVLADGTACRNPKAPGYFDERSAGFDAGVEQAIQAGDLDALLAIELDLAQQLMATGRPAWQVLAGAHKGDRVTTEIRYCDDPFGVAYLVASLRLS